MKAVKVITSGVVLLAAAAGVVHLCNDELIPNAVRQTSVALGFSKAQLGSYIGYNLDGSDWTDVKALQSKLEHEILENLQGLSNEQVKAFLSVPRNRLMMAQWMLANAELKAEEDIKSRREALDKELEKYAKAVNSISSRLSTGATLSDRLEKQYSNDKKKLAELEAEKSRPLTLAEFMRREGSQEFMELLGNNLDWLEQLVYTGECVRPARALDIIHELTKKNPELIYNQMERDIATATAMEFARYGWMHDRAMVRADYYLRHWRDGELNDVFGTLPFWERRLVCGCKGDNDFGSIESLEWLLENAQLPADRYPGSCWRCAYRLFNLYGESIHGPHYVEPYADVYGENRARFTYEVGGVCGSLSHFGAFAALANGVPAMTAGEPGHCAYLVKVGEKWVPAYSLSWQRGLHWQPWNRVHVYSSLHMMGECFSDAQQEATTLANAYRTLGAIYAARKDAAKTEECYNKSLDIQPLNLSTWREYADYLAAEQSTNATAWKNLNNKACNLLVPRYPEVAAVLMQQTVYPGLDKAMAGNPHALQGACELFWKRVKEMGIDRWRIEELLNIQMKLVCDGGEDDQRFEFLETMLSAMTANSAYAPVALSWSNEVGAKMTEKQRARLMKIMLKSIGGSSAAPEDRAKLLVPIVQAAEQSRDMTTFQALAKMLPAEYTKPKDKLPEHKPFPGKLMSKGGMLWTSSTSQWDRVCAHWGLLEPGVGGQFHTAKDNPAWVVVQLPRQAKVTGVVVMGTTGNLHRLNGMKVQISNTGKDDDWHDVGTFSKVGGREFRAEVSDRRAAKYVRILRPGGPDFFHLSGIFVYGEQAA